MIIGAKENLVGYTADYVTPYVYLTKDSAGTVLINIYRHGMASTNMTV